MTNHLSTLCWKHFKTLKQNHGINHDKPPDLTGVPGTPSEHSFHIHGPTKSMIIPTERKSDKAFVHHLLRLHEPH